MAERIESDKFHPDWDEYFASNLRRTREAMGLTQSDMAERMRDRGFPFHQATIYKIEKGDRKVSIGEAMAIAWLLDVSIFALAEAPQASVDGEYYSSVLWERTRNLVEAMHDIWSATDRFKSHQDGLVSLLDLLLTPDGQTGRRLIDDLPIDDYQETLLASIKSMYASAAATPVVSEFRDRLIAEAQHGDLSEAIGNVNEWPGSMPEDPELDDDEFSSWQERAAGLRRRWGLADG